VWGGLAPEKVERSAGSKKRESRAATVLRGIGRNIRSGGATYFGCFAGRLLLLLLVVAAASLGCSACLISVVHDRSFGLAGLGVVLPICKTVPFFGCGLFQTRGGLAWPFVHAHLGVAGPDRGSW